MEDKAPEPIKGMPIFDENDNIVGFNEEATEATRFDGTKLDEDALTAMAIKKAKAFVALEKRKKIEDATLKATKEEIAILNNDLLKIFAISGTQQIKIDGRSVFMTRDLFASALATKEEENNEAAKERLFKALSDTGHGDLVKKDVNGKTLASLVREFDPDKTFDAEVIKANMPPVLAAAVKLSIVPKMTSRKS